MLLATPRLPFARWSAVDARALVSLPPHARSVLLVLRLQYLSHRSSARAALRRARQARRAGDPLACADWVHRARVSLVSCRYLNASAAWRFQIHAALPVS